MACGEANPGGGAVAKASLKRRFESRALDPKRVDLALGRLKRGSDRVEDRTHVG